MPVLVNAKTCVNHKQCYAALGCPYDAYLHNPLRNIWEVDATRCGDCPAPCMNFCDSSAVLWADNLFELDLLRGQLAGTLTADEVAERRAAHKAQEAALVAERAAAQGGVIAITSKNFMAEVVQATLPVVMDCWADWCGPCKTFAPIFAATAREYAGVVKFVKLDTEAEPALAQRLGIKALPTTLFFYRGQLVHGLQGAVPTVADFSGVIYQVLLALQQMDPALQTGREAAPAPPAAGSPAGGLITGPDPGPPSAPTAEPPPARRPKPRLYLP